MTGPVTRNMAEPLRRTAAAMGEPRLAVAVGDCAINCGEFAGGYGVEGAVSMPYRWTWPSPGARRNQR